MIGDIVIPKNNEAEFIEIAAKLGIKKLYFLYEFDEYNKEKTEKKLSLIQNSRRVGIEIGLIVSQKNINKAFKASRLLVAKSSAEDRALIENKKIKIIYGFEEIHKKDRMHQRESGLNHIICGIASKNDVAVGFSYSSLLNKNPVDSSQLIGRMIQNIRLCQKYKVKTVIGSFSERPFEMRARHDITSLFTMLGAGTSIEKNL